LVVVVTVPPAVHVRESVVAWSPIVPGFARMLVVQLPRKARSFVEQVSATIVKFVESSIVGTLHPVADWFPLFENVKFFVPEFVPASISPKS
jgi:hypothetical protein